MYARVSHAMAQFVLKVEKSLLADEEWRKNEKKHWVKEVGLWTLVEQVGFLCLFNPLK